MPPELVAPARFYTRGVPLDDVIRWFHLLAATVWIGGMITVAALVPALRKAGVAREQIQAGARRFGVVAWFALTVSVVTGITQLVRLDVEMGAPLAVKLILVGIAVSLAFVHQEIARGVSPGVRGAMEGMLLVLALGILGAAVAL